jgi:hypothetical protein
MGEEYIQGKKGGFKHKCEAGHEEQLGSPNLLSAIADKVSRHYRFQCGHKELRLRSQVRFIAEAGKDVVSVFHGNERVGEVDRAGSADLQRIFSEHPVLNNSIPARVCALPDVLGFFEATIELARAK